MSSTNESVLCTLRYLAPSLNCTFLMMWLNGSLITTPKNSGSLAVTDFILNLGRIFRGEIRIAFLLSNRQVLEGSHVCRTSHLKPSQANEEGHAFRTQGLR